MLFPLMIAKYWIAWPNCRLHNWKMKAEPAGRKHIGPMAQDFYAAFGLGDNDRYIGQGDAQGVALAAIKGLYEVVQQKDAKIATLEQRITGLETLVKSMTQPHRSTKASSTRRSK